MTRLTRLRLNLWQWADDFSHWSLDWYINAKPFGHHTPGWGHLQHWQWHLCNACERRWDEHDEPPDEGRES